MFKSFGAIIVYFACAMCCGSACCDKCFEARNPPENAEDYSRSMEDPMLDEEEVPGLVDIV